MLVSAALAGKLGSVSHSKSVARCFLDECLVEREVPMSENYEEKDVEK